LEELANQSELTHGLIFNTREELANQSELTHGLIFNTRIQELMRRDTNVVTVSFMSIMVMFRGKVLRVQHRQ
jgi:hypothetical protein